MGRPLTTNVAVHNPDGDTVWYGPDYGNADQVPDDVELDEHCYSEPDIPDQAVEANEASKEADDSDDLPRRSRSRSKG